MPGVSVECEECQSAFCVLRSEGACPVASVGRQAGLLGSQPLRGSQEAGARRGASLRGRQVPTGSDRFRHVPARSGTFRHVPTLTTGTGIRRALRRWQGMLSSSFSYLQVALSEVSLSLSLTQLSLICALPGALLPLSCQAVQRSLSQLECGLSPSDGLKVGAPRWPCVHFLPAFLFSSPDQRRLPRWTRASARSPRSRSGSPGSTSPAERGRREHGPVRLKCGDRLRSQAQPHIVSMCDRPVASPPANHMREDPACKRCCLACLTCTLRL